MVTATADRHLLFGLLALQNGLIDQVQLVASFQAWTRDKARALADHLVARGDLGPDDRAAINSLVECHLKKNSGDVEKSLAAVPTAQLTRERLALLADPDLDTTLCHMGSVSTPTEAESDRTGTYQVGINPSDGQRFRVLRPHAQGGLGAVFVAMDSELNREVALKQILDNHADDPTSRQRFLLEAEITGGLEHPGIVPVYGLGAYGDGRPYYAMRFIRGDSLKDAIGRFHNDERLKKEPGRHSLALHKLLRRFIDVCNAIEYAHSRGVVHRDIKPANVIVGKHGETLVVDWGLAKPLGRAEIQSLDERPLRLSSASGSAETLPGTALGTPAYMSPEQARGDLEALGPRSDVYSLGATLYCLLTGKSPLEGLDVGEVLRRVQKGEYPSPGQVDPAINKALEAVCLKAMALNPDERYPSCRALADDLERWAADEPVSAYPDPPHVRAARWARKHRLAVAIGAGALQTAVVLLVVTTLLLGQSRARIERAQKRAETVNAFLVKDLLAQADPEINSADKNLTVRELLDKSARALDVSPSMKTNPEVEGSVRSAIGNTYYGLGLYPQAREQLERAVACQERAPGFPKAERIFTLNRLGWVIYKSGKATDAEFMSLDTLAKAREWLGPDHEETVYAADNLATMSVVTSPQSAFTLLRENLAIQRRVLGPERPLTLRAAHNLASALMRYKAGDDPKNVVEALELLQSIRDSYNRTLGADHPETLWNEEGLGFALARQGKFHEAREVLAPLQERSLKVMGTGHLNTGWFGETFALAEEGLGHLEAAESLLTESYDINNRLLGAEHVNTLQTLSRLARVCLARGKNDEATAWYATLIIGNRKRGGKGSKGLSSKSDPAVVAESFKQVLHQLGPAFAGTADASTTSELFGELRAALSWLCWKDDWTTAYVGLLNWEAWIRLSRTSDKAEELQSLALPQIHLNMSVLESNPLTPSTILANARARVGRIPEAVVTPAPSSAP